MPESGDNSGEDTPVPISNTEVKLLSADDTWRVTAWESRSLPVSVSRKAERPCGVSFQKESVGNGTAKRFSAEE